MIKFILGAVVGAIALAYYPMYIDDVKQVTNDAAKAVVEATDEQNLIEQAKEYAQ